MSLKDTVRGWNETFEADQQTLANNRTPRADTERARSQMGGGVPHIRRGEDPLNSRPFYICRAAAVVVGQAGPEMAKQEIAWSEKLRSAMGDVHGQGVEVYGRNSVLIPLSWDLMPETVRYSSDFAPMREAMDLAVSGLSPEFRQVKRTVGVQEFDEHRREIRRTSMSYLDQTTGGALVAPPQFGDLIPILRNKAVMPNIGAVMVPLPPQGSIKYPRQTGVTTIYEKPENTAGTESNPTFDDVMLEPKQFIGLCRASNQLLTFAPGVAEMAIRNDLTEQIGLTFDYACLEGTPGPNRVAGLRSQATANSWTVTAKTTGANGDTWAPVDVPRMIAKNMDRNSDLRCWICRPRFWLGITEQRADAVSAGDKQGAYLYKMLRDFGEDFGEMLRQRKVVTSNQVPANRTKGSASNLTYMLGVDGQEILIGMHGVMVLDANPWETTAYSSNQTLLRAIMFGDMAVRRGAGVALMDTLVVPNLD